MAEDVLLSEVVDWLVGEVLGRFVVVLPRTVALVKLDEDEDHDCYYCSDDGQVDQERNAYAQYPWVAVLALGRRGTNLVRRRRV